MSRSVSPKLAKQLLEPIPAAFVKFNLLSLLDWQIARQQAFTNRLGWFASLIHHRFERESHLLVKQTDTAIVRGGTAKISTLIHPEEWVRG